MCQVWSWSAQPSAGHRPHTDRQTGKQTDIMPFICQMLLGTYIHKLSSPLPLFILVTSITDNCLFHYSLGTCPNFVSPAWQFCDGIFAFTLSFVNNSWFLAVNIKYIKFRSWGVNSGSIGYWMLVVKVDCCTEQWILSVLSACLSVCLSVCL